MVADACHKRCVECKKTFRGTIGKAQWCPRCGGEMRPIHYGPRRRKVGR